MANTNKIRMNRWGLLEDPRGLKVKLTLNGRDLLGDVRGVRVDHNRGMTFLEVYHFNGEKWPLEPNTGAVEVI